MGTVKYTGPVASFHCPTNAEIRSLKVHFSPKQEGSGDPSPENVRPIVGWDGVKVYQTGKNLIDKDSLTGTDKVWWKGNVIGGYPNPSHCVTPKIPVYPGAQYYLSRDSGNQNYISMFDINGNYLQQEAYSISGARITIPDNVYFVGITISVKAANSAQFELGSNATLHEPYQGSTTDYEFGTLGKNKLNVNAEQQAPSDTSGAPKTKRTFTPGTYCVGMSWSNYYYPSNVTSYSVGNGTITVTNGNVYGLGYPVRVTPGQAYYLSATTTNGRAHIAYFSSDGTYVSGVSTDTLNKSFTVPSGVDIAVIVFFSVSGEATFSNIQLELGSTATAYEPYDPKHTVYGGWVDLISGEVCEEYWKIILDGVTTNRKANRDYSTDAHIVGGVVYLIPDGLADQQSMTELFCDNMPILAPSQTVPSVYPYIRTISAGSQYLRIYTDSATDHPELDTAQKRIDFVNEYLSEHPSSVAYKLKYPNTYRIAPTALQTFLGHNNVWSNADYVEVEYDLHETQSLLQRKAFIMANQPHIVKPAAAALQNFKTDVIAPLKECKVHFSPVQEGTGDPSPDNVRAISGWTGVKVTRCGKNMLPAVADSVTKLGVTYAVEKDSNGSITRIHVTGTSTGNSSINTIANDLILPSGNYTLTAMTDGDGQHDFNLRKKGTSTDIVQRVSPKTFSISETTAYQSAYVYCKGGNTFDFYVHPMIRLSSIIDDTFEPYSGTTIPVDWTTEAGTVYGGYVDLVSGEVWKTHSIASSSMISELMLRGTAVLFGSGKGIRPYCPEDCKIRGGWTVKCTHFSDVGPVGNWSMDASNKDGYVVEAEGRNILFLASDLGFTTKQEWAQWIIDNNVQYAYPLEAPILLGTITPLALKTLRGTNNIWSNANGNIDLAYWGH